MSLLLATSGDIANGGVVAPEGTEFDGVTDYLSRSSDLVGNVDSKTFTFSAWVYFSSRSNTPNLIRLNSNFVIQINTTGSISLTAKNSGGTTILNITTSTGKVLDNGFYHILLSVDMSDTNKRMAYINDGFLSLAGGTFTNDLIDFTGSTHYIATRDNASGFIKGRLSNLCLLYEYMDLSIEANRRLFITADGKPTDSSVLKALNPILYLPMKDAFTAHINEGTGGNFTQNGTLDTASRGANQWNCKSSYFDGVADYLRKDNIIATSSYVFTISTIFSTKNTSSRILHIGTTTTSYAISLQYDTAGSVYLLARNSANTDILQISFSVAQSKTNSLLISCDMQDQYKLKVVLNGVSINPTITTFVSGQINIVSGATDVTIGSRIDNTIFFNGNIGELWFNTNYTDLSTSNPFWDSTANRPKPVRQVIQETGVTPLIAMPLDASNAGKNYGTGGDFTANSAPYVGARGGSEFWARSAKFGNTTAGGDSFLYRNSISASNSKTFTVVFSFKSENIYYSSNMFKFTTSDGYSFRAGIANEKIFIHDDTISSALRLDGSLILSNNTTYVVLVSIDLSNTAKRKVYINGILDNAAYTTYVDDVIPFSSFIRYNLGANWEGNSDPNGEYPGSLSMCYFTTDYIDFSQEVNRLKFVDGLGYPKDLKAQIDAGVIPKPLFYLPFDDPTNLGKDASGNNNHFIVNGTVTQGADVLG